jgi:hypothetical protein
MAETTQTLMPMDNLNLFPDNDIPKDGKEGEYRGHRRLPVDDQKRYVVNFEPIGEVADACAALVRVGYDNDFMSPVDELLAWDEHLSFQGYSGALTVDNW